VNSKIHIRTILDVVLQGKIEHIFYDFREYIRQIFMNQDVIRECHESIGWITKYNSFHIHKHNMEGTSNGEYEEPSEVTGVHPTNHPHIPMTVEELEDTISSASGMVREEFDQKIGSLQEALKESQSSLQEALKESQRANEKRIDSLQELQKAEFAKVTAQIQSGGVIIAVAIVLLTLLKR